MTQPTIYLGNLANNGTPHTHAYTRKQKTDLPNIRKHMIPGATEANLKRKNKKT